MVFLKKKLNEKLYIHVCFEKVVLFLFIGPKKESNNIIGTYQV